MARWKNSRQEFNTFSSETTLTQNTLKVKKKIKLHVECQYNNKMKN